MLLKNALSLMLLILFSFNANAADHSSEVATCKKELSKSNFFFSAAVGAQCMDLFFLNPQLNEPVGSFNFVSEFGEKILVKQPDNLNMYFTVFFIYYSQWRLSVVQSADFRMYSDRLDMGFRLLKIAENRFGPTEAFLKEKARSLNPIAIYYAPSLRAEVIATFYQLDKITSVLMTKIISRNSISRLYEVNLEYQKAIDVLKTILEISPNRENTLKKIQKLEEKLNQTK